MLVDWTTVLIQVVNFVALVVLLRVVLYDRVLAAMEARRRKVAARWDEAERREAAAKQAEADFLARQKELAAEREETLAAARSEAAAQREALLAEAEAEVAALREAGTRQVEAEGRRLVQELRVRLAAQLQVLARRALTDLADADLEAQVRRVFLARLGGFLAGHPAEVEALTGGHAVLRVRSAFALDEVARGELEAALRERLGAGPSLEFETDPDLVCGIELRAGGRALGWSVDAYLDDLGEALGDLVHASDAAAPAAPDAPAAPQVRP